MSMVVCQRENGETLDSMFHYLFLSLCLPSQRQTLSPKQHQSTLKVRSRHCLRLLVCSSFVLLLQRNQLQQELARVDELISSTGLHCLLRW
jgi:hypothetical protein